MVEKPKRETFKDSYDFKCFKCEKEMWAKPSIMMRMGINQGHGTCPDCKSFFHLEIEGGLDGDKMICSDWKKWVEGRKKSGK